MFVFLMQKKGFSGWGEVRCRLETGHQRQMQRGTWLLIFIFIHIGILSKTSQVFPAMPKETSEVYGLAKLLQFAY